MFGRRITQLATVFSLMVPVSLATVGCGPSTPEAKVANVKAGSMPEGGEWQGVYYSTLYGYLHILSDGRTATGAWRTTAGDAWGELAGEVDGDLLKFQWTERKIGAIGADATKKGNGYFRYTVPNPDEPHKIVGEWGLGDSNAGNAWEAIKQVRMPPNPDSVKPDEIEGRTNVRGWDDEGEEPKKEDSGSDSGDGL